MYNIFILCKNIFVLGPVGKVQNVAVSGKLYGESNAVIVSWVAPNKTNGQSAKSFRYLVKYCLNGTKSCTNTTLTSATFVELTGLSASYSYSYMIFVLDANMVLGSTFNGHFFTAARGWLQIKMSLKLHFASSL